MIDLGSFSVGIGDWLVLGNSVREWDGKQWKEITMAEEKGPVEDDLEDPAKQDDSGDLPEPLEGNEDEDDSKQDQQHG